MKKIIILPIILLITNCSIMKNVKDNLKGNDEMNFKRLPVSVYSDCYCVYRFYMYRPYRPSCIITVSIKKKNTLEYTGIITSEYYNLTKTKLETAKSDITHFDIDELFKFLWKQELFSLPQSKQNEISNLHHRIYEGTYFDFERYFDDEYIYLSRASGFGGPAKVCGEYFIKMAQKHKVLPEDYMQRTNPLPERPKPDNITLKSNGDIYVNGKKVKKKDILKKLKTKKGIVYSESEVHPADSVDMVNFLMKNGISVLMGE